MLPPGKFSADATEDDIEYSTNNTVIKVFWLNEEVEHIKEIRTSLS